MLDETDHTALMRRISGRIVDNRVLESRAFPKPPVLQVITFGLLRNRRAPTRLGADRRNRIDKLGRLYRRAR